jgi:pantetheine-phosphate adenylyltransferase
MTAVHPATKNSAWFLEGIIESRRPRIGLYPGTFSPFHTGHLSILEKAENIFDKVIIAVGINPDKDARTPQERLAEVQRILPFHEVIIFSGFLTELIQQHEEYADITVIRGLRNGNDLDYEVNQLRFMEEQYSSVRTMYLVCDKQFEHISSTSIRNLSRINPQFAEKYTPVKYQYFSGTE